MLDGALGAGPLPAELADVEQLTTTGFADLMDRAISLACLAMLVPTLVSAYEQLELVSRLWLGVLGGALVATSVLMPFYAWSRRGIRPLAGLYAVAVLAGLATWPFAWQAGHRAEAPPLLWMTLGLAIVCAALAANLKAAAVAGALTAGLYFWVRQLPSGGGVGQLRALQDAFLTVLQPAAVLLVLHRLRGAVAALDSRLARSHAETADAAVNQALVDERRRLDAIVHDEVMTTLVAGAASQTEHDAHVAQQAQQALASLQAEADPDREEAAPVSADQLVRLVKDVTASVCPRIEVIGEIPAAAVTVPPDAVRVLMQASREAALNAEKHSRAAHVQALVHVTANQRRVNVRISITDDGQGFDLDAVPAERLGVRLALRERMKTIGGRAEVASAKGRGTNVRLTWSGARARLVDTHPRTQANPAEHPVFQGLDARPIAVVGAGLTLLYAVLGIGVLPHVQRPDLALVANLWMLAGLAVGIPALLRPPIRPLVAWFLGLTAAGGTTLTTWSMMGRPWPEQGAWFVAPVMLLLVIAYAGGRAMPAWAGATAHAGIVLLAGTIDDQPLSQTFVAALLPAFWLALAAFLFFWLDSMWAVLDEAAREVGESARLNATVFSKMVLREVWLTELRAEVGPMLALLAEQSHPLSDDDRAGFRLMESSLRDGIKASNFSSPGLAAAIMDARTRGVSVTLVDNRGSRLPEGVRRVTLAKLEEVVRASDSGRIVARTAPEGYTEAVTILQVAAPGDTRLTRIAEDGTIATGAPATVTE